MVCSARSLEGVFRGGLLCHIDTFKRERRRSGVQKTAESCRKKTPQKDKEIKTTRGGGYAEQSSNFKGK